MPVLKFKDKETGEWIEVSGGSGGGSGAFIAEYGVTTNAEVEAAYQAGKTILCAYNTEVYRLTGRVHENWHEFGCATNASYLYLSLRNNKWQPGFDYFKPEAHASSHATGGTDPITPESIGAASTAYVDEKVADAGGAFIAEYGVTTADEIRQAYYSGKSVFAIYSNHGMDFVAPLQFCAKGMAYFVYADMANSYQPTALVVSGSEWQIDNAGGDDSGSGLPEHTTADNGKFLRVVDGAPAWATVQNIEEVEF